jgi:hypothetical protein
MNKSNFNPQGSIRWVYRPSGLPTTPGHCSTAIAKPPANSGVDSRGVAVGQTYDLQIADGWAAASD